MARLKPGKSSEKGMKTYIFRLVLEAQGASTWGETKTEALKNIHEVLEMILEGFLEEGRPIPTSPESEIKVLDEPAVSVTI